MALLSYFFLNPTPLVQLHPNGCRFGDCFACEAVPCQILKIVNILLSYSLFSKEAAQTANSKKVLLKDVAVVRSLAWHE